MTMTATAPLSVIRGYVDGAWLEPSDEVASIMSPLNGASVAEVHTTSLASVDRAVESATDAAGTWWDTPSFQRAAVIASIADEMEKKADLLAAQMTAETGRAPHEARVEVVRAISTMRISAEEATRISGEMIPMDAVGGGVGKLGFTLLSPVGVVAAVTPFNAPLNTICHKLGPALAGGNTIILKPHHHGSGVAAMLVEICEEAEVPASVFQLVLGGPDVGSRLTTHPGVSFVNFTGSGFVAEMILKEIGLKRTLLELGGNAPTIVHSDADLEKAVSQCAEAGFGLAGQSCISTQRIYVHEDVVDEFTEMIVKNARSRNYLAGPGTDGGTGPLLTEDTAKQIEQWVKTAVDHGANLAHGGGRDYTYVEPTVLTNADPSSPVVCEEIFGPVVVVLSYEVGS